MWYLVSTAFEIVQPYTFLKNLKFHVYTHDIIIYTNGKFLSEMNKIYKRRKFSY